MSNMSIGGFGFYARILDTEGHVIGIWEKPKEQC
jgi:predicted enzyme related to lactoylglutathione lyase